MGETRVDDVAKGKPTIVVPPRGSMESLFANGMGGIFSPGPMTLVSSFFSDQGSFSFSQLLAGAMASPVVAAKPGFLSSGEAGKGEQSVDNSNSSEDGKGSESSGIGYKHNRPMTLVVAPPQMQQQAESFSPLFMIPSGLSPSGMLNSPGFLSPLQSPFGMSHQQALAHVTAQAALSQSYMQMHTEFQHSYSASPPTEAFASHSSPAPSETLTEQMNHPAPTEPKCSKIESSEVSQSDKKSANVPCNKPANDGYNWRKYGQKQVKASECPRSYYKCTYQNCSVKKKVERSFDGNVSEIVYKGEHNHSPPQSNKRKKDGSALDRTNSVDENEQEVLTSANQNDESEGPVIVIDDENDDEPLAKRRSLDNGQSVVLSSHQTITESKIVVQTRSEVDLLDDGYKWRKYGQKVVKGNPHPRSYYRCTYAGCNVRKHVERSSADAKAVITTYEGKHKHEIPAGRYSRSNQGTSVQLKTTARDPLIRRAPITLLLKEEQIMA